MKLLGKKKGLQEGNCIEFLQNREWRQMTAGDPDSRGLRHFDFALENKIISDCSGKGVKGESPIIFTGCFWMTGMFSRHRGESPLKRTFSKKVECTWLTLSTRETGGHHSRSLLVPDTPLPDPSATASALLSFAVGNLVA